jgi:hypothetical protein
MLAGRPLAWLDYHRMPQLTPVAWSISHRDEISQVIAELAEPPARKLHLQNQLLCDHLYLAESASGRLVQLVKRMLELTKLALETGNRISFPAHLLPAPRPVEIQFDQTELYPSFNEFKEPELLVARAEWAHCRREIAYLQAELRQAKSELAEAHAIFDEIQKHPIAGPIVRLRQKLIDRWRSWRREGEVEVPDQAETSGQGSPTP